MFKKVFEFESRLSQCQDYLLNNKSDLICKISIFKESNKVLLPIGRRGVALDPGRRSVLARGMGDVGFLEPSTGRPDKALELWRS